MSQSSANGNLIGLNNMSINGYRIRLIATIEVTTSVEKKKDFCRSVESRDNGFLNLFNIAPQIP
jgi:hypothetical protein